MDKQRFWAIIEASKKKAKGESIDERSATQLDTLKQELAKLEPEEIVEFQEVWDKFSDEAYDWGLWGAAYILGGGCSDDGFIDFRSWLITQGQAVYENALEDPETLAGLVSEDDGDATQFEGPQYVAGDVWSEKTGKDISDFPRKSFAGPKEPKGQRWSEEGDDLERRFPKLSKKFGC